MSPKVVFLTLLCASACFASAQNINLGFSDDGDRQIWIASDLSSTAPTDSDGVRTGKSEAAVPIGAHKDSEQVFVWDHKAGNIASKTVGEAKKATWEVKPPEYAMVAQFGVHVEHGGKAVAAATVDVDDGKHKASQLLDPSCKGTVLFFGIKPGSAKVTVHYKVSGKDATPLTTLYDVVLAHKDPVPTATISLADNVETVGAGTVGDGVTTGSTGGPEKSGTPASGGKSDSGKSSNSVGSVFGSIIIYLVALGAIVAGMYYAMQYVKKNPDSVGSKLEQLGVQIPKPGDDPLTDPSQMAMPSKPAPMPVQKIILDDAAPDPIGSLSPSPTAFATSFVSDPRLIGSSGDAMPLPEGELIVGREVGLGLSLVGESTVSRKHAQILRNGAQVVVKDFGSTNGTFINGVQVQGEKPLQSGDTVQFGSVRFRFEG